MTLITENAKNIAKEKLAELIQRYNATTRLVNHSNVSEETIRTWLYHTSKPYSKGYMAFAKNYIVNFTIPNLSDAEKQYLLSNPPKQQLNSWIWRKYGIDNPPAIEKA